MASDSFIQWEKHGNTWLAVHDHPITAEDGITVESTPVTVLALDRLNISTPYLWQGLKVIRASDKRTGEADVNDLLRHLTFHALEMNTKTTELRAAEQALRSRNAILQARVHMLESRVLGPTKSAELSSDNLPFTGLFDRRNESYTSLAERSRNGHEGDSRIVELEEDDAAEQPDGGSDGVKA